MTSDELDAAYEVEREALREEGRRDILRQIADLNPFMPSDSFCAFCWTEELPPVKFMSEEVTVPHRPGCLWLQAQSLTAPEPVK